MSTEAEVWVCIECGRPMRSPREKAADHPGTIVRGTRELCVTHYKATRAPSPSEGYRFPVSTQGAKDVVLATVAIHYPQRADCRPSCCKTPYNCARGFQCGCHGEES